MKKRKLTKHLKSSQVILPDKKVIAEVVEIFFENQYKGIFPLFHKPTYMSNLDFEDNKDILKPSLITILAILALCSRLHPELPKLYGNFKESDLDFFPIYNPVIDSDSPANSSKYFGYHAKKSIEFDCPSIENIQALCILSSHEWGEGNAMKSFMYSGIATRMALILGLNKESDIPNNYEDVLRQEVKRRAMWSCYMMDRCNASGRNSNSCINLEDIHINLPCTEKDFLFGTITSQISRDEAAKLIENNHSQINTISCNGFLITLFETWRKISKWVGETGGKLEKLPPWDEKSPYFKFSQTLENFHLPDHLKFTQPNIQAHIADNSAGDFAYFHGLYFLCKIFLIREYFYSSPNDWWLQQTKDLFQCLDNLDSITKILKPMNLMVIAPFTGFQVFTTGATAYYISAYPNKIMKKQFPEMNINKKYSKMGDESMEFLKSWSKSWGLGKNWIDTLQRLKEVFGKANIDDDLRHKMHDYGNIDQTMQIKNIVNHETELDFIHSLNLSGIFPDWNDVMF